MEHSGPKLPEPARDLLLSDAVAHVVTLAPGGRPHVTLAWVGLDGDDIVMGTLFDQRKLQNIRSDPRITISVASNRQNEHGLTEYLVVYGRAEVVEGGAPGLLRELAQTYIGPGTDFPPMPNPPPGFTTRVTVERLAGVGPWTG